MGFLAGREGWSLQRGCGAPWERPAASRSRWVPVFSGPCLADERPRQNPGDPRCCLLHGHVRSEEALSSDCTFHFGQ